MIDNFEQIKQYLTFDSSDDFYYVQIIQRRKENPELKTNNYMVKSYAISSIDYLDMKKKEIVTLCELHNARAYINLNKRSFEKCAYHSMKKLTDVILAKSFKSAKKVFDSVASAYSSDKEKKWLIDVDDMEFPSPLMMAHIEHNCKPYDPDKIIGVIKTLNGCHLITKPFNIVQFRDKYPDVEVKKNSPTLLYYSK
jgi:hypothetical protein